MVRVTGITYAGCQIVVLVPEKIENRLDGKRFLGCGCKLAGNFSRWGSLAEMVNDSLVLDNLVDHACDTLDANRQVLIPNTDFTRTLSIEANEVVGWAGSIPRPNSFDEREMEWFKPNTRCRALRIKHLRTDILSPRTNWFTIRYRLVHILYKDKDQLSIIVQSVHTGPDIGVLVGEISDVVLFGRRHPGE